MTKYGSPNLKLEIDDDAEVAKDLSEFVTGNIEIGIQGESEEVHGFGDDWVKHLFTGMKRGNELTLEGFYDDATDGPDDILNAIGDTRKMKVTYNNKNGANKYSELMVLIKSYVRRTVRNELHKFTCTVQPTGKIAEDEALT